MNIDLQRIAAMQPEAGHGSYRRGLLPRKSKPGFMDCGGDKFARCKVLSGEWELTDAELSRPSEGTGMIRMVPRILHQKFNSCGSESACTGFESVRNLVGLPGKVFNPLSVYHFVCGGRDAGSGLDTNLRWLQQHGICPEDVWPYANGWRTRPNEQAREIAKQYRLKEIHEVYHQDPKVIVRRMRSAVRLGFVAACGSKGHAVLAVHDDGTNYPVVANTWSKQWGEQGFGKWDTWLNLARTYGCWVYRTVRIDQ